MSLGPVVWFVTTIVYFIFLLVWSAVKSDEYEDLPGFFNVILFVVQYSENYQRYVNHKENVTNNYQKFLNTKYE